MSNDATNADTKADLKKYLILLAKTNIADIDIKIKYAEALEHIVPFEGWQDEALTAASRSLGLNEYYHRIIFSNDIVDALAFFEQYINAKMLQALELVQEELIGVTNKIEAALYLRIFKVGGSKLMARKTAAYYSRPTNTAQALKAAWQTADIIWYAVGDRTTDYNYYTKRSLLSSIYLASLVHYLNNDDQQKTAEFITKALAKTVQFAKLTKKIKANIPNIADIPIIRMFL